MCLNKAFSKSGGWKGGREGGREGGSGEWKSSRCAVSFCPLRAENGEVVHKSQFTVRRRHVMQGVAPPSTTAGGGVGVVWHATEGSYTTLQDKATHDNSNRETRDTRNKGENKER